ncbi:HisA/HisF-related TIM barrel protein [Providencia vermicola]|uniref:1-(5-phosphoribosyl)-5-[(5-phosphoribosylamino)methylideneamino] imidazole-4-carboxamide isomerase n=1 Tax=Providencia vermicola TaxID=333965 RepID=A0AAX3S1N3_9GAMM|nr:MULTISPECIES: HisA/HisF-related TIM barrel protein [Providencia]ELX8378546.1 1-(5-phosphoribosyl)-5-((5-phosphoribosylamino)methylideneamino)imidazole-4-carboxamide isomerase [Providencia stuartii]EMD5257753.1 1-(5-phosphoribosyl)-5-((5-phosphoribosylamino)methylideneamino)imidazole-4-carboxamide isomerase [Providencia stuartii]USB35445.1 HisA/HisF-related TIM barrel protein [Providencia vermicola]WFC07951.1 HisA/HisF-related TIM barrel protein [Providencia vermicola]
MLKFLDIYPSIDIVSGYAMVSQTAIKITQGKHYNKAQVDNKILGTPVEVVNRWQNAGAKYVHMVDLDAAAGKGDNYQSIKEAVVKANAQVQICGGIRDDETLSRALNLGCQRVNIGTAALENVAWCEKVLMEYGDKIAIALDVKQIEGQYYLTSRGWNIINKMLWPVLERLNKIGCQRYVVTDVDRGGMLSSPNFDLLQQVCNKTASPIIAGGGVASLDDIKKLSTMRRQGIEGVILGQALHIGLINLPNALLATKSHDIE